MTDHAPLAAAMETQGHALRALARSILRNADGAEDVVQEACAAALASGSSPHNAGGWLATVVRNFARRRLRDQARRGRLDAALADESTASPPADELPAELEVHRRLAEAVGRLREPLRRAIVLRYWHDLPPRLISRRLGTPVATVKTHLQRGLAELRTTLLREQPERRAWLVALYAFAHPHLITGAATGAPVATAAAVVVAIMKLQHAWFLAILGLCVGVLVWQPWVAPQLPPPAAADETAMQRTTSPAGPNGSEADVAARTEAAGANQRVAAEAMQPTCTVVGRILTVDDRPVSGARMRLLNHQGDVAHKSVEVLAEADGSFALQVPQQHDWIPYAFALADAPGWAVRELQLDADVQKTIADHHLDLGVIRLERGVAVAGRVVEADGTPLRARACLLAWDPARSGSWPAMFMGRGVGFVEPGGPFQLDERLSATAAGTWLLAAISASGTGWAELTFAAGQEHLDPVEIRLLAGGSVEVQVVDAEGRPVAGASVHASPHFKPIGLSPMYEASWGFGGAPAVPEAAALFERTTDAEGQAHFDQLPFREDPLIRDANQDQRSRPAIIVAAARNGYVTSGAEVDPGSGSPARITITLQKQRSVSFHGVVRTPDGQPRSGVEVRQNGGDAAACVSDAEGHYRLPAAVYHGDRGWFLLEGNGVPRTFADADVPATGTSFEHDFAVELRSPVHGCVVDQSGAPVEGVELMLGPPGGGHAASTPGRTGADGRFAFPDAVASHTDLWVEPPDPPTAWRLEPGRALTRRDGEVVTLQRLAGPFVDLTLAVVDGRTGAPVSPTEVDIQRLHGSSPDWATKPLHARLALGAATATKLRPGSYRAAIRGPGDLSAAVQLTLSPDAPTHVERVELWPAVTLVCTVDVSALSAAWLAAHGGDWLPFMLEGQSEHSQAIDAEGKRLPATPDCADVQFGGEMTFRLEHVTPNAGLRLVSMDDDLLGETWFRAEPGSQAHVTIHVQPAGRLVFAAPAAWPAGTMEVEIRADGRWWPCRLQLSGPGGDERSLTRPAGSTDWRVTLWPANGDPPLERSGTASVVAGTTVHAKLD